MLQATITRMPWTQDGETILLSLEESTGRDGSGRREVHSASWNVTTVAGETFAESIEAACRRIGIEDVLVETPDPAI